MKKAKILLRFEKLTDAQLQELAKAVEANMTGNAHFREPKPTLADFTAVSNRFTEALSASKTKDQVRVAFKKQTRKELELVLTNLSVYCSYIANGDRSILTSSGFTLNAETSIARILDEPKAFTANFGQRSGEIVLSIAAVRHAKTYLFLWSPNPAPGTAWFHATNSLPSFTIPGLTPGSLYHFQVGVTGTRGQVVYTKVITQMAV